LTARAVNQITAIPTKYYYSRWTKAESSNSSSSSNVTDDYCRHR